MNRYLVATVAAAALCAGGARAAVNLVTNGGFETGSLTGWTTIAYDWFVLGVYPPITPYAGSYFASTACVDHYCELSQTLATTPGTTYDLSFAFNPGSEAVTGYADTYVTWGGAKVLDVNEGPLGWSLYSTTVTAVGASTVLAFEGFQDPYFNGLDDVSVVATVPEPAAWVTMIIGFGVVGAMLRRRRAVAAA